MKPLDLKEYTKIAKHILYAWVKNSERKSMYRDFNDIVANLVYILIKSDEGYNIKNGITMYSYRQLNCYRYMKKYDERKNKYSAKYISNCDLDNIPIHNTIELEEIERKKDETNIKLVHYLKNNANLTSLQKEHIDLYLSGKTAKETAEHFGTTPENVYQILKESTRKMKVLTGSKV